MPISPQCPRRCAQSDARGLRHTSPLRGSIKRIVRAPLGGVPSQGSELPSLTPEASLERTGSLSRLFGSMDPIIDLRQLNHSVSQLKFKMLTLRQVVSQIRSKDWFVTIDLKDAYFHVSIHPCHRKFLRFAFGGKAYQYRVLPFGLALSPRTFTKVVDAVLAPLRLQGIRILNYIDDLADSSSVGDGGGETSRCRPRSYETVGVETKRQEKCAFSGSEDHLFRRGVEFDHDAGTNVACSDRVDFHVSQESERRPVTYCQAVSEIAGSDGSCVQRDTGWPAVHETPAVVAQDQGIFPEGKSTSHHQGLSTVCASPRHVEETLVLKSGPGAGSSVSPVIVSDGRVSHRLGSSHEWPLSPRSVEWSPSHMAHQLSRDVSGLSSTKIFPPDLRGHMCWCAPTTQRWSLTSTTRGSALAPVVQTGTPDPLVVPGQVPLTESTIYSWVPECGPDVLSRQGPRPGEWIASPRGGEADMENILSGGGGPLRNSSECAMSPLVLSSSSSSLGLDAMVQTMAEATSVRFSPDRSAPRSSDESTPRRCSPTVSSPVLAGPSMVLGPDFPPRRLSMGGSHQEGSPLTSRGCHSAPPPGVMETVGVAPEGHSS